MRITVGSELALALAAHEATIAQFAEIEPEHLLMALLKLPELPREELKRACKSKDLEEQLRLNREELQDEIEKRGFDGTQVRRGLRTQMGKGDRPQARKEVCPSLATRNVMEAAGRLADESGAAAITPRYMLATILQAPTHRMEAVLPASEDAPLPLHECGHDLVAMASAGKLRDVFARRAEANAVLQVLAGKREKWVFLVSRNENDIRDVLAALAHVLAGRQVDDARPFDRLLDLSSLGVSGTGALSQLDQLLGERPRGRPVLLVLPSLGEDRIADAGEWMLRLRNGMPQSPMRGMCRVDPHVCVDHLTGNTSWRGLAHVLHVGDVASGGIPAEL